jgi:hypothetical protein
MKFKKYSIDEQEKMIKLYEMVKEFRDENKISCEEDCYQNDSLIEQGMEFMENAISIIGFYKNDD